MANNLTTATNLRNDVANLYTGTATTFAAGTNQQVVIYSGTPPANAAAALSGNTAIATLPATLTWGAASAGVATTTSAPNVASAVGGTASFYRRYKTDGVTVCDQGLCGTSAAELTMSSLTIAAGASVTLNSGGTFTAPL
jgi:hypothetical protein